MNKTIEIKNKSDKVEWKVVLDNVWTLSPTNNIFNRTQRFDSPKLRVQHLTNINPPENPRMIGVIFHLALKLEIEDNLPENILNLCPVCQKQIPDRVKNTIRAVILSTKFK